MINPQPLDHLGLIPFHKNQERHNVGRVFRHKLSTEQPMKRPNEIALCHKISKLTYTMINSLFNWVERDLRRLSSSTQRTTVHCYGHDIKPAFSSTTDVHKHYSCRTAGGANTDNRANNNRALKARWLHRSFKPRCIATGATSAHGKRLMQCTNKHTVRK